MANVAVPEVQRARVVVDAERCKGCDLCVVVCPQRNLHLSDSMNRSGFHPAEFRFHGEKGDCTACGLCYWVCPDFAIAEVSRWKA
ncbi:MAG: ferredoxin family protein [Thermoplasmata archaeon]|jgi:2-oxoglutarate ferredoxin oxidoreductase subunit delta